MNLSQSIFVFLITFISFNNHLHAQDSPDNVVKKLGRSPLFFIDSARVSKSELNNYDPKSIASLNMLTDSVDKAPFGMEGEDGVVFIETIPFARKRFVRFFRKVSTVYDSLYSVQGADSSFCYVINDKLQINNYEGNLASIDDKLFISLTVINADELKRLYAVNDKKYGILVRSHAPSNLYRKEEKF